VAGIDGVREGNRKAPVRTELTLLGASPCAGAGPVGAAGRRMAFQALGPRNLN
jgi:hypothetical protein